MKDITIIGVDLAKNVFQLHGATADGTVVFRKKLSRPQFQRFISEHPRLVVATTSAMVAPSVRRSIATSSACFVPRPVPERPVRGSEA